MLIHRAGLQAGESVLVVGSGGGVNSMAIQIAKLAGAFVLVVAGTPDKAEKAKALGADVVVDRSRADWVREVLKLTGKRGVDAVVDNVGSTFPLSLRALRKGGRLLTVGNTGGPKIEIDNRYIFGKQLSILGSTMGTRADFAEVMALVFSGTLQPVIDRSYALEDTRQAHERLETGRQMGKIVLDIAA